MNYLEETYTRLTLTWDVFKFDGNQVNASMITRLTLTWDVFKW